ncbi:MAG: DNA alkylation repair protein [Elusimicrobium sp.]|uniref:DNA alkylation repair protein n=1 Tax=Candidatus Avelusimicrobium gallicola TaxID=2562704 RepID=A0A928DT72_9BACT|nr:DNA alkylation repair protein [Elusimicrobium sp.]
MDPVTRSRAAEILARIERNSSPSFKKQMKARFGINTQYAVGTPVTTLRLLLKAIPCPDQDLAEALWQTGVHEARILASMVADPKQMTREKLDAWVKELNSWDICDLCCQNLFSKVKNPAKLAERWIKKEDEYTRRAGFAVLCFLASPRAKTTDEDLIKFLPLVKNHAADPRPMVYKAVNWALRNIGKKNSKLTPHALTCAEEILYLYEDNKTAQWVAKNALWELNTPKIKALIAKR